MRPLDAFALYCMLVCMLLGWSQPVSAHDASHPHVDWFKSQKMTPETKSRLGYSFTSCCDKGDHFDTRFRVVEDGSKYGAESYEYLTAQGTWKRIHPDIIQRKKTPDGRPVLFILQSGVESCFIIDEEGI